jgi:hypothetical protein
MLMGIHRWLCLVVISHYFLNAGGLEVFQNLLL